ncbi:MAG: MFS transporter, partial [Xanthomonadales bacterium]|nr:MFS transporter [Xanthomonadales bacterium]
LGVYGLSQALLQQAFGRWSDRWGRRRVILAGLALFVAGSVVAAMAEHIWVLIGGRALQGCGAIAGVTLAFAADHTRPERRSVVMAIIGMGIGASFLLSIMVAVPLSSLFGLQGLFWITAALGLLGMALLPRVPGPTTQAENFPQTGGTGAGIAYLCASVFLLHALMTALFVALPYLLVERYAMPLAQHWKIYVPTMLASVLLVFPLLWWLGRRHLERASMPWAFALLSAPLALFSVVPGQGLLAAGAVVYFVAFNLLEATMPSLVSRMSGAAGRGRTMGRFTTFQFLGAFAGGALGGASLQVVGAGPTLLFGALVSIGWAWVSRTAPGGRGRPE